jgi:hypothetical protein
MRDCKVEIVSLPRYCSCSSYNLWLAHPPITACLCNHSGRVLFLTISRKKKKGVRSDSAPPNIPIPTGGCGGRILSGVQIGIFFYLLADLNNGQGVIFGYHVTWIDGSGSDNGPRVIFTFRGTLTLSELIPAAMLTQRILTLTRPHRSAD